MTWIFAPIEVLTDARLTDSERRVLMALFSFRNKETNTVWPGREALAQRALIGDPVRVSKITSSLAEKGWLTKRKVGFSGRSQYLLMVPSEVASDATNGDEKTGGSMVASDTTSMVASDTTSMVASDTTSKVASDATYKEHSNEHIKSSEGKPSESDAPDSRVASTPVPGCPHREIIALYHEILPELQGVLVERWDGQRAKDLASRWRESPKHQALAFWRWYFGQVRKSRWHLGENDRGWRADLGWLIKRRNFDKILESAVSAQRRRVAA